jgi:hypothetical protein
MIKWHEVAHHFYAYYMNVAEKDKWEKMFNRIKKLGKHNFYREYGMTNPDE